jgi:hypothetical protein
MKDALRAVIDGVLVSGSGSLERRLVFAGMARSYKRASMDAGSAWWSGPCPRN